ncbi:SpoIVB peptidase S55 domain-containing protein [Selenomonas ruminantium]|uniref:SpoIVB peptidase S55 domain-containing protein n=1 Tax=Selenomonas ruminantium TaxID=971 RepID=UPI0026EBD0F6|nr:SpoIVB peptidase S55 domain-containing protein [Selenomonas ruminantium]
MVLHKYIRKMAAWGLAAIMTFPPATGLALDPVLPHSQVTEGMVGTAYTVIDSSGQLRDFQVDIVGNMENGKGSQPMIMAKASGPVIEQTGGILQGMSGSPVYVDGYLIGAVAAGIKDMTPYTFFITPIDEMLPLWSMPDTKNKTHISTINIKKAAETREKAKAEKKKKQEERAKSADKKVYGDELVDRARAAVAADKEKAKAKPEKKAEEPVETEQKEKVDVQAEPKDVMYFSGFNQAGLDFLKRQIDPQGSYTFLPMGAPSAAEMNRTEYHATLEPGAAVGVAVTYGDFAVGATGTVTAVDGKKILAFGHPFLHRGNVNYFMTDATVVGTISGQSNGMKVANIGNIIGRISQDRATGIAGTLGQFPSVVPIKVSVKDNGLARSESYGARIAYDEDFLPQLSGGIAYAALSKTSDNLSGSTAKVGFKIRTDAVKDGVVTRDNMFYNTADVGQIAMAELMQAMSTICQNADKESDIIDVQVDITVDGGRKTASLISAVPDKKKVKPGDTVKFTTTIKPYRKAQETLIIPYKVPDAQPAGTLNLDIRGGGLVPVTALMLLQQSGVDVASTPETRQTTEDRLHKLEKAGKNNEIVIAPGPVQMPPSKEALRNAQIAANQRKKAKASKLDNFDKQQPTPGETKFATGYIIDNVIHSALTVERG